MDADSNAPGRFPVLLACGLYALLFGLAALWSWLRGDPALLHWAGAEPRPAWLAAGVGLGAGLLVVGASRLTVRWFTWARALEQQFIELVGPLGTVDILALTVASAVAEEAFFRGAMQPSLGLVATSLIFGLLHAGPGRVFVPWTLMALGLGFGLGGLALWSGGLLAPVACHATINGLNLHALALKARRPGPDRR